MKDPINNLILPAIGAVILYEAWVHGWLPWSAIKEILFHD